MNEDKDLKWVILILLFFAFAVGFTVAQAIYDDRPITEEEYYELQKTEWYE